MLLAVNWVHLASLVWKDRHTELVCLQNVMYPWRRWGISQRQ